MLRLMFGFPSAKEIATAVENALRSAFEGIKNTLTTVERDISNFPKKVETALSDAGKGAEQVWKSAERTVGHAEQSISHTADILDQIWKELEAWTEKEEAEFKNELKTFLDDLAKIPGVLTEKVASLKFDLDKSVDPYIEGLLDATPGVVLWGLDRASGPVQGWLVIPGDVLELLQRLPPLEGPPDEICPYFKKPNDFPEPWEIHRARTSLRLLVETMDFAMEIIPKDLSVTAVAVGGGGTEVAGHPVKWPFLLAKEILKLTDYVLTRYLEEQAACANWKPAG